MSFLSILAAVVPFTATTITDPIDDTRLLAFAAADDENMLLLACKEGTDSLTIRFVPDRYYGPPATLFFEGPEIVSRFSRAKPEQVGWYFQDTGIDFMGGLVGANQQKAKFLDDLARDDTFSIRYAVDDRRTETVTINYTIDPAELSRFLGKCNPKRVNQYLREWGSPAAPSTP